jgi:hypothetical protein
MKVEPLAPDVPSTEAASDIVSHALPTVESILRAVKIIIATEVL